MIVRQIHQCALTSSLPGNGCDLGIRKAWLPLFDTYSVDLVVNGADSIEEATWSAMRDPVDAYGFALFAVDPGGGPGQTSITMTYFHAPEVSGGSVRFQGTTQYSVLEQVVFGRALVHAG